MPDGCCHFYCIVQPGDFRVSSATRLRPSSTRNVTVQVTFENDNVALEPPETFRLRLMPFTPDSGPLAANEFFLNDIELTIIDSTGKFIISCLVITHSCCTDVTKVPAMLGTVEDINDELPICHLLVTTIVCGKPVS